MKQQQKDVEIAYFTEVVNAKKEYESFSEEEYALIIPKFSSHIPEGATILEAGCGTGSFGRRFFSYKRIKRLIGCDINPLMIARARELNTNDKCEYICSDLETKDLFPEESFDCIVCPFILHHIPSLNISNNLIKWCKKEGIIIIIETNGDCFINKISKTIRNLILRFFGEEYLIKNKMGTPNETDHPISSYVVAFSQHKKCDLASIDFVKNFRISITKNMLGFFKRLLYFVSNYVLSQRFGSGMLILVFKRNS